MSYAKIPLAHVISFITTYADVTAEEVMLLSLSEIEELREAVASSERAKIELQKKLKKLLDKPMPSVL